MDLFEEARRQVRWHYQWAVLPDFLPRVVNLDVVAAALEHSGDTAEDSVGMPVDVAHGVFRHL